MAAQVVFILPSVGSKEKIKSAVSMVCGLPRIVRSIAEIAQVSSGVSYVATDSEDVLSVCREYGIKAYRTSEDISHELRATEDIVKRLECINVVDDQTMIIRIDPSCKWVSKNLIQHFIQFQSQTCNKAYGCVGVKVKDSSDELNHSLMKVLVGHNSEPLIYSLKPVRVCSSLQSFYNSVSSYVYVVGIDAFNRGTLSKMFSGSFSRHSVEQAQDAGVGIKVMVWDGMPPMYYDDNFTTKRIRRLVDAGGEEANSDTHKLMAA